MVIYATPISSFAMRVRLAAAFKGLSLEFVPPPCGYRSPEYRAIVPTGTLPALVDGDFVLAESDTIIEYLDEVASGPRLLPEDPRMRATTRMLSRLHDFRVEPHLRALMATLPPRMGAARTVHRGFADLHAGFDVIARMAKPSPFLAGDALTLADCAMPATIILARRMALALGTRFEEPAWLGKWQESFCGNPDLKRLVGDYDRLTSEWISGKLSGS